MRKLTFYTNMPTPYQVDFFDALKEYFSLTVVYFTDRENDRLWKLSEKREGYKTIVLKNSWIARLIQKRVVSFHFSWSIIPLLFKDKPDFVITNGTYYTPNIVLTVIINRLRRRKVYYWSEPIFPVSSKFLFYLKYIMFFPVRAGTDAIFAIGRNAIDSYREYGYRKQLLKVPYNINIRLFERAHIHNEKLASLLLRYKPNNEVIILTSGALVRRKGVDTLINAFLKVNNVNARLLILGDGPYRETLEKLALPAGHRIQFAGFIQKEDVPYYFGIADVFAFASRYDGWALVINEALAADLPIICSDQVGAAADLLVDGVNAAICAVDDVPAFATAMESLIADHSLRAKLVRNAQNSKKEISSAYNAEKIYGFCNSSE